MVEVARFGALKEFLNDREPLISKSTKRTSLVLPHYSAYVPRSRNRSSGCALLFPSKSFFLVRYRTSRGKTVSDNTNPPVPQHASLFGVCLHHGTVDRVSVLFFFFYTLVRTSYKKNKQPSG